MLRYWLATDQAKVQLNLAVCPGAWLMSVQIITKSMVGYNKLRVRQFLTYMIFCVYLIYIDIYLLLYLLLLYIIIC